MTLLQGVKSTNETPIQLPNLLVFRNITKVVITIFCSFIKRL